MRRVVIALVVATTASVIVLAASPTRATAPGENGRIAFRAYFNEVQTWGAIFTINPDGTGLRQVTHPPRATLTTEPDVSPDGRWIVYQRWRAHAGHGVIFRIRLKGTHRENLTGATCPRVGHRSPKLHCIFDTTPGWSPNGRHIAFTRVFDPGGRFVIYEMRADGTHIREITEPGTRYEDLAPQYSPDGTHLVFVRFRERQGDHAIFTVRVDGTHERRLTPWRLDCTLGPDWSPNGRWLLFTCHRAERTNLWLLHPNGTELHRITSNPKNQFSWYSSSFSPDGTMIVTSRSLGVGGSPDVYVMNLDGSDLVNVTQSSIWDSSPDWGPRQ